MVSMTLHIRQVLGEWQLTATLWEHYGEGLEPDMSRAVWQSPLTGPEWDSDPLSAVLGAVARWSGMTIEDASRSRLD